MSLWAEASGPARLRDVAGLSHIPGGAGLPFRNRGLGLAVEETDKSSAHFLRAFQVFLLSTPGSMSIPGVY